MVGVLLIITYAVVGLLFINEAPFSGREFNSIYGVQVLQCQNSFVLEGKVL
jgi:hypothetical protein